MDNKLTRNLSLGALLGLFALYGHTVHNLRVDSVSTAGIVVKYRGLASTCTLVDKLEKKAYSDTYSEVCQFTKTKEKLPNGGTKYTIVALNKGYKSTESISFTKSELDNIGEVETKINNLTKNLARQSRQTAKDVESGIVSLEDIDSKDTEVTSDDSGDSEIVVPESESDDSEENNNKTDSASVDLDEDSLDEALEKYEELQNAFNTCQLDKKDDEKIFKLIENHQRTIKKYQSKLAKEEDNENDDEDEKSTFDKLSKRGKEKIQSFADDVAALDIEEIEDRAENNEERTTFELINCQSKHATLRKNRSERFEFYKLAVRPLVRRLNSVKTAEELIQNSQALDGGEYGKLVNSTPDIKSVSDAEQLITLEKLTQDTQLRANAQVELVNTYNSASDIAKKEIVTSNTELNNLNKDFPSEITTTTSLSNQAQNINQGTGGEKIVQDANANANLARLQALLKANTETLRQRTKNAKQGTGNAFDKTNIRNITDGTGVAAKDSKVNFERLRQQRAQQLTNRQNTGGIQ